MSDLFCFFFSSPISPFSRGIGIFLLLLFCSRFNYFSYAQYLFYKQHCVVAVSRTTGRLAGLSLVDVTGHDHAHILIIIIIIVPQKIDPGRKRRDVHNFATNNTINTSDDSADSMILVGRVHVYSPDDLLADNFNQTATDVLDPLQAFTMGNNKTNEDDDDNNNNNNYG